MINSNEWIVKIYENPQNLQFSFYIISNGPGNIRTYVSDACKGEISILPEGGNMENASMILSRSMMEALFTALQGQGIKPIEQSYVEGKLESTEKHLEDMRRLVFEK